MIQPAIIAAAAAVIALAILWLGRRDLSRPAVAFGVSWFTFLALAQLRLTDLERPWSTGFTLVAFGGGLLFVLAAVLAAGTAGARGTIRVSRDDVNVRRLIVVAVVLILVACAAAVWRAGVVKGVPLFADNPDAVRARAFQNGEAVVPAWASALIGGFYIGMWATLAAIWAVAPRVSKLRLVPLWLLALAALVGVALDASRNLVVFALAVPAVGAYLLSSPGRRRTQAAWIAGAACMLVLGVGGLYALRLSRGESPARNYVSQQADKLAPAVRPLLPVYVNAVYPIEAERRVYEASPGLYPYELGAASLTSLPDKAFPEGKSQYGRHVADLMATNGPARVVWTVASYQGRLLADLGWRGVMLGSTLLGLLFGALYRWARGRSGFLPVGLIAYVAYYSAFMVYDNQLSFSLIAVYDLTVIALVSAYALGWTDRSVAAVRQLGRRLAARERVT